MGKAGKIEPMSILMKVPSTLVISVFDQFQYKWELLDAVKTAMKGTEDWLQDPQVVLLALKLMLEWDSLEHSANKQDFMSLYLRYLHDNL